MGLYMGVGLTRTRWRTHTRADHALRRVRARRADQGHARAPFIKLCISFAAHRPTASACARGYAPCRPEPGPEPCIHGVCTGYARHAVVHTPVSQARSACSGRPTSQRVPCSGAASCLCWGSIASGRGPQRWHPVARGRKSGALQRRESAARTARCSPKRPSPTAPTCLLS